MDFRYLLIDHDHGICRITLNRPERLNAINIRVGPWNCSRRLRRVIMTTRSGP